MVALVENSKIAGMTEPARKAKQPRITKKDGKRGSRY